MTVGKAWLSAALCLFGLAGSLSPALAENKAPAVSDWTAIEKAAEGQTVQWNAWGGAENINAYIDWVGERMEALYGVSVNHVRLSDTAEAVSRVLAEKAAGRTANGSVDLIWINGENFVAMKERGLLETPGWATLLPNWKYVDVKGKPTVVTDFTVPTDGLESPWGMAKLTFWHDTARTEAGQLPHSAKEIADWLKDNPGRFTYPAPPDFIGSTFLKQLLVETAPEKIDLSQPATDENFAAATKTMFAMLDEMRPNLWRGGQRHPENYPAMKALLADGEIDILFAFNPGEASSGIAAGELPETVRPLPFPAGTLGNSHFVTVPFNAANREGALLLANFLISPEAQIRKENAELWGDPTVLDVASLPEDDRKAFESLPRGPATPSPEQTGPVIVEPHASWQDRLEAEWEKRYVVGG
ncbi:ABC transporter substrate-binding protein [Notoacmeibacter sp. MSK16QG-6]|uniref:ABC transporter substrate-binding protein n=1 Tax=Notoacmeibacter sp. MSK16QG-6 TaxID=2957982 RepID=UPI00209DED07|nr:ABC transporter substrate-binding protein [Notoacmeibacter sp. MSK16QG-6]MCP1198926.1 ABC transporter substrate-binding protein [Notoacmeibacter sp. MSK16QG-6]